MVRHAFSLVEAQFVLSPISSSVRDTAVILAELATHLVLFGNTVRCGSGGVRSEAQVTRRRRSCTRDRKRVFIVSLRLRCSSMKLCSTTTLRSLINLLPSLFLSSSSTRREGRHREAGVLSRQPVVSVGDARRRLDFASLVCTRLRVSIRK